MKFQRNFQVEKAGYEAPKLLRAENVEEALRKLQGGGSGEVALRTFWYMGVGPPKNRGLNHPQIIHLFIGFGTIVKFIHFGGFPLFLERPIYTLPKINSSHLNIGFHKRDMHLPTIIFQVLC